jgi:hypothetical protein
MPGPLGSTRPGPDAYTTRQEGTWSEPSKDAIGMYRGKSKTRDEGYSKSLVKVGVATPGTKAMGQPPSIGQATFKRKRK